MDGGGQGEGLIYGTDETKVAYLSDREHRTGSRRIKVLNLKSKTVKLRGEIVGKSFWPWHREGLLKHTHIHTISKAKGKKTGERDVTT